MPRSFRWFALTGLLAMPLAFPPPAFAGAWTRAEGDGLIIMTSGRKTAPAGAMFKGLAERDTTEMQIYAEYGLTGDVTLGAIARGEWVTTTQTLDLRLGGHLRYSIWRGEAGDVVSVQAGGSLPVERWFGRLLAGGTADHVAEVDAGLLYGKSWQAELGDSFVTGHAGMRWRGGAVASEFRFEATAGYAPSHRLMGLFSLYAAAPMGDGDASLTLSPSIAYTSLPWLGPNDKKPTDMSSPSTLQLSLSFDVLNPGDGLGFGVSIWNRF